MKLQKNLNGYQKLEELYICTNQYKHSCIESALLADINAQISGEGLQLKITSPSNHNTESGQSYFVSQAS